MNLTIHLPRETDKTKRYLGKALEEGHVHYSKVDKVIGPSTLFSPDTVHLVLGKELHKHYCPGDTLDHHRGSVFVEDNGAIVIYTYSPDDTSESVSSYNKNLFDADLTRQVMWWYDTHKAVRLWKEGFSPLEERFNINPSLKEIKAYAEWCEETHPLLACDLETFGWKDSCQPFLVGLASSTEDGFCIPLYGRDKEQIWTDGEFREVKGYIQRILSSADQVYQNALFDVKVLRQNDYIVPDERVKHDTMLLHHTIDSALPHTLDFIVSVYGETPYWKATLKAAPTRLMSIDPTEARIYNLRDCVTLHQILPKMLKEAEEKNLLEIYYNEAMAGIPCALEQMETGIFLSHRAIEAWRAHLHTRLKKLNKDLHTIWPIGPEFNLGSNDHIGWLVANQPLTKFEDLKNLSDYEASPKQASRCKECNRKFWAEKGEFPPICTKCGGTEFFHLEEHKVQAKKKKLNNKGQVSKTYQNLLDLEKISTIPRFYKGRFKIKTSQKTKKYIMDEKSRTRLRFDALKALEHEEHKKSPDPDNIKGFTAMITWLETYDVWCHVEKQRSTYTEFPTWNDGKVHYNILLHGTETGRPAARDINVLNQPTKNEKLMGACYVAPKGWSVVSMD